MPLGTLERSAPSLFRQGPSALSQLVLYSALALFLMVADARLRITDPLRKAVAAVLYPAQWIMLQPVEWATRGTGYFQSLQDAKAEAEAARAQMAQRSLQVHQSETLAQENEALRKLLGLRERLKVPSLAAQILYETADPYTRRVMLDRGQDADVQPGSPVLDGAGVLGQVTRVYPLVSEVTLLTDREQAIPVLNARTGARGVAYGDPVASHGGGMELRFVSANADVQDGDMLTTSGLDGVYPAGLPVARVVRVERRADSAFARIYCAPVAAIQGARHVLVLQPEAMRLPQRPEAAAEETPARKKGRK
ncbi:MAG: rod shape-determining protein MreC [Burkholderiales bacterium]|jgi:rod shape-determining protein MreC|nr:rod shape-determining protein MreC [Burkholderiales bacterium]